MAHIFFERLERRRSTQALTFAPNLSDIGWPTSSSQIYSWEGIDPMAYQPALFLQPNQLLASYVAYGVQTPVSTAYAYDPAMSASMSSVLSGGARIGVIGAAIVAPAIIYGVANYGAYGPSSYSLRPNMPMQGMVNWGAGQYQTPVQSSLSSILMGNGGRVGSVAIGPGVAVAISPKYEFAEHKAYEGWDIVQQGQSWQPQAFEYHLFTTGY